MSDLRQAALFALTTLHGWSNHDNWVWPQSALAQAKQNTTEAIFLLEAALAEPEPEGPTDEELLCIAAKSIEPYDQILPGEYEPESNCAVEVYGSELVIYARAVLARWGK